MIISPLGWGIGSWREGDAGWGHPAYKGRGVLAVVEPEARRYNKGAVFRKFRQFCGLRRWRTLSEENALIKPSRFIRFIRSQFHSENSVILSKKLGFLCVHRWLKNAPVSSLFIRVKTV